MTSSCNRLEIESHIGYGSTNNCRRSHFLASDPSLWPEGILCIFVAVFERLLVFLDLFGVFLVCLFKHFLWWLSVVAFTPDRFTAKEKSPEVIVRKEAKDANKAGLDGTLRLVLLILVGFVIFWTRLAHG